MLEPIETSVAQTSEDASRVLAYDGYLRQAVESIDCRFGDGYAAANPQLVAAYITAGMQYYVATTLAQHIRAGLDNIAERLPPTTDEFEYSRQQGR